LKYCIVAEGSVYKRAWGRRSLDETKIDGLVLVTESEGETEGLRVPGVKSNDIP